MIVKFATKVRITTNKEYALHSCDPFDLDKWEKNFKGKEVEVFLPPVLTSNLKMYRACDSKFQWELVDFPKTFLCVHQFEAD